jgi:hypothetical protein
LSVPGVEIGFLPRVVPGRGHSADRGPIALGPTDQGMGQLP